MNNIQGISPEDCKAAFALMTTMEKDVFYIVPNMDSWDIGLILKDSCVRNRSVRDQPTLQRCLDSLVKQGVVVQVDRNKYRKARNAAQFLSSIAASSVKPVFSVENEEQGQVIDKLGKAVLLNRYAEQLRQESTRLLALANGIEDLAGDIDSESEESTKLADLRNLLRQFVA